MASKASGGRKTRAKAARTERSARGRLRTALHWTGRGLLAVAALVFGLVVLFVIVNPPVTPYMIAEGRRHGPVARDWVPMERIAPVLARSVVAAEDANFCLHWGFDMAAIRQAMDAGGSRGASTISQQTVKNVYLWHGRSWSRKALEAALTPVVELVWPKRRILEVYLNVAEFDRGVFGAEAAARHYFRTTAAELTPVQAARLAAILPDPKGRSASEPTRFVRNRAAAILDGAETIRRDGRAGCFEG
jgi:monofunctional glycosyltransferase